jgi:ribosomal protein S18 acetylase RimI-like enzyme
MFTYREANINDLAQLKRLGISSYGQFNTILGPEASAKLHASLNDEQKLADLIKISKCFVCEKETKLIGMAHIIPSGNPWEMFQKEWSYIRMVGVDPKYGGQGIAKKLTGMCIDFAKQNKERIIALHTSEFMDAARHIYESLGFKILKEIEPRYGKKYWLYTLEL